MKKQIRRNVFETNSSSCHSFSYIGKMPKPDSGIESFLERAKNGVYMVELDGGKSPSEEPVSSTRDKFVMAISNVPEIYDYRSGDPKDRDNEYRWNCDTECRIPFDVWKEIPTVKAIIDKLSALTGLTFEYNLNERELKDGIYFDRCCDKSEGWGDGTPIFDKEFYEDIDGVIDFILNPEWVIYSTEYYDG